MPLQPCGHEATLPCGRAAAVRLLQGPGVAATGRVVEGTPYLAVPPGVRCDRLGRCLGRQQTNGSHAPRQFLPRHSQ